MTELQIIMEISNPNGVVVFHIPMDHPGNTLLQCSSTQQW